MKASEVIQELQKRIDYLGDSNEMFKNVRSRAPRLTRVIRNRLWVFEVEFVAYDPALYDATTGGALY